jgi:hypothetical protein
LDESLRDGTSDAAAPAGDNRSAAREIEHRNLPRFRALSRVSARRMPIFSDVRMKRDDRKAVAAIARQC